MALPVGLPLLVLQHHFMLNIQCADLGHYLEEEDQYQQSNKTENEGEKEKKTKGKKPRQEQFEALRPDLPEVPCRGVACCA